MSTPENIGEVLFSAERIQDRVRELGEAISKDYKGTDPVLICMLRGAAIFTGDLVRSISVPLTLDFYGHLQLYRRGKLGCCEDSQRLGRKHRSEGGDRRRRRRSHGF